VGPTLQVEADEVRLAFVGAEVAIDILDDETASAGTRIETKRSVRLRRGEVVRIGSLSDSAVLYVAVEGGFDIAPVFGSVATFLRGGFGGWEGRALAAGDRLPLVRETASTREDCRIEDLDLRAPARFRVIVGPQDDHFSPQTLNDFFAATYSVDAGSDRTGMRLAGPRLDHIGGFDIASDGIAAGSIQVPGSGQPIVLLADRQTTGGYPKIATVISADLPALGRLPIGAKVAFAPVTLAEAEAARRELFAQFDALASRIVPIGVSEADLVPRLHGCNLIDGVVDARHWAL
jgi:biotin-dependent carboxylase-like uncharacterized protein